MLWRGLSPASFRVATVVQLRYSQHPGRARRSRSGVKKLLIILSRFVRSQATEGALRRLHASMHPCHAHIRTLTGCSLAWRSADHRIYSDASFSVWTSPNRCVRCGAATDCGCVGVRASVGAHPRSLERRRRHHARDETHDAASRFCKLGTRALPQFAQFRPSRGPPCCRPQPGQPRQPLAVPDPRPEL
eukprot:362519-Chlamydomonas_euryale.AAC.7